MTFAQIMAASIGLMAFLYFAMLGHALISGDKAPFRKAFKMASGLTATFGIPALLGWGVWWLLA